MIFATVGSQMPFDRLIQALDDWAATQNSVVQILAQIGDSELSPKHINVVRSVTPSVFREQVQNATAIVAHAGMGAVLTAMEFGKPLVIMPRHGARQETRNDHQVATAKWLTTKPGIYVAMNETELGAAIEQALQHSSATSEISPFASPELLDAINNFIHT